METLNALQVLNANAVVYFCSERSTNDVAAVRGKFAQHRRKVRPVEAFSEKQGSVLFALQKEDVRIPVPWSFCNVRKNAPTSFGPRDSGIVRLYGRWSAE